jgi:hypothetical protein
MTLSIQCPVFLGLFQTDSFRTTLLSASDEESADAATIEVVDWVQWDTEVRMPALSSMTGMFNGL